jgi:hypothetical protein
MKELYRVIKYCVTMKDRGLVLKPNCAWSGLLSHEFVIAGRADSMYASCPDTMRSIGGQTTLMEGAPIIMRSKMQKVVTLSSTEAELMSGTECAQDMLYSMRVVKSLGLKVKKPMILEINNKGTLDIANNWSVGDKTRHIDTRFYFLRELKEANPIKTIWRSGTEMSSDVLTKNLARPLFGKHLRVYCSEDQCIKEYNQTTKGSEQRHRNRGECRKVCLRYRVVELALSRELLEGRIGESVRETEMTLRRGSRVNEN